MTSIIKNEVEKPLEFPCDYTIVDIETTGLSPQKCEIIEISAIKVRNDMIVDKFSSLIKPDGTINSFITGLTGISNKMVDTAPCIKSILPKFMEFLEEDSVLGHNVSFDVRFISFNLKKHFGIEFSNDKIDTMLLSRKFCNLKSNKLDSVAKHYNISTEGHHRAMNDCVMTFEIYKNIKKDVTHSAKESV